MFTQKLQGFEVRNEQTLGTRPEVKLVRSQLPGAFTTATIATIAIMAFRATNAQLEGQKFWDAVDAPAQVATEMLAVIVPVESMMGLAWSE